MVKVYEAGEVYFDGKTPVPSYDEYQDIIQQNVNQEAAIETYIEDIKRLQEQLKLAESTLVVCASNRIFASINAKEYLDRYVKGWESGV